MTYSLNINAETRDLKPIPTEIVGPYSVWPRKPRKLPRVARNMLVAGAVGTLAVLVHCVTPMVI